MMEIFYAAFGSGMGKSRAPIVACCRTKKKTKNFISIHFIG